jgi:hypothetical protein
MTTKELEELASQPQSAFVDGRSASARSVDDVLGLLPDSKPQSLWSKLRNAIAVMPSSERKEMEMVSSALAIAIRLGLRLEYESSSDKWRLRYTERCVWSPLEVNPNGGPQIREGGSRRSPGRWREDIFKPRGLLKRVKQYAVDFCFHRLGLSYKQGQELLLEFSVIRPDAEAKQLWAAFLDNFEDDARLGILRDRLIELELIEI